MGVYADQILPRVTDLALRGKPIDQLRQQATATLDGEVLEVGFGSGRNVPYYPQHVDRVRAVDPATVGRKLAAERVAASGVPIEYVGLDGQQLPLDDVSVDHVLTTWTLCTIPDVERALAEMRRVLRPGRCAALRRAWSSPRPRRSPLAGAAQPAAAQGVRRLPPRPAHRRAERRHRRAERGVPSRGRLVDLFKGEEVAFGVDSAEVAAYGAVGAYYPVAGDDDG